MFRQFTSLRSVNVTIVFAMVPMSGDLNVGE